MAVDAGMYTILWLKEIEPLLPSTLQQSGISSLNGGGTGVSSSSVTSKATTTTSKISTTSTTKSPTTTSASAGVPLYGQCGGIGYTGSTVCSSGTCEYSNPWYLQCL